MPPYRDPAFHFHVPSLAELRKGDRNEETPAKTSGQLPDGTSASPPRHPKKKGEPQRTRSAWASRGPRPRFETLRSADSPDLETLVALIPPAVGRPMRREEATGRTCMESARSALAEPTWPGYSAMRWGVVTKG